MTDEPPKRRRRWLRWLLWGVAALLMLPVALVLLVVLAANTGPGRALIERETAALTGGTVRISGLSGRFPDRLRLAHAAVRDADGAWVTVDGVALDWAPWRLASRTVLVERLEVERLAVPRLPVASPAKEPEQPSKGGGFSLPVHVVVERLDVHRLVVGAPVVGLPGTETLAELRVEGSAAVETLERGSADVRVTRLDAPGGTYAVSGRIDPGSIAARLSAHEPAKGLISTAAHLPDLGAIGLEASVGGPRTAERTALLLTAGELHARANGTVDLSGRSADLDVEAGAPAMAPAPGTSWKGVAVTAKVHGPFTTPTLDAHVRVEGLEAGGAAVAALTADANGDRGAVSLTAEAAGVRVPGPRPELLAGAPVRLEAHATLSDPRRPVRFTLSHPLLAASGHADTGGALSGHVDLTLPELGPLAEAGGVALAGHAALSADVARGAAGSADAGATRADVTGTVALTGGQAQAVALLGDDARLALGVTLDGGDVTLRRLAVDGRALHLTGSGTDKGGVLDVTARLGLPDLAAATPAVDGSATLDAHVAGRTDALTADATLKGDVGAQGVPRGPVTVTAHATGLPGAPDATVTAEGRFDGSPVRLAAAAQRGADGALRVRVTQGEWKSARLLADLVLPRGATLPLGSLDLRMARLADLEPVLHRAVTGAVQAQVQTADAGGVPEARLDVRATDAGIPGDRVGALHLSGTVRDPAAHPAAALRLEATGIAAGTVTGAAQVAVQGPEDALAVRLGAQLAVSGQPAVAEAGALVDVPGHSVRLDRLSATYREEAVRLLGPARVQWAPAVTVDRLRLGLSAPGAAPATVELAGRVSPTLDLTAAVRGVTPALARPFAPTLDAQGEISAQARLTGSTAAPAGTVRLDARGLRMRTGPGASVPPANLAATAQLGGGAARVDARLDAGRLVALRVSGRAPLSAEGAIDLRAGGTVDLAVTDPILTAAGRRARGTLTLDATATGTVAQPRLGGTVRLAGGEVQDYAQGVRVSDISALIALEGQTLRIRQFLGHAGPGTISVSGSVGALAPGLPVDLRLTATNARPIASDLVTATINAALAVTGTADARLDARGTVDIVRADINVPSGLPPSVAKLDVIRPGQKPPPAASAPSLVVGLDVTAATSGPIFVRGHGLDAELGGRLHVGGTAAAPQVSGGFDMRRGTFSLAGVNLTFTRGRVGFDGTGVRGKIDPTLDFVANNTAGSVTATLAVGGYADAPKITLSSSPPLPQDQVLAELLFGTNVDQLSAFQVAEIASAVAELSGVGGGSDVLGSVRKGLGLDRLSVGSSTSGNGASLQAGKYVAPGVYVGAKEGTDGGTQAQVQIDLTKHLKLESQLGTGGGVPATGITPQNDPGSSVGLKYQFEY